MDKQTELMDAERLQFIHDLSDLTPNLKLKRTFQISCLKIPRI